MVFITFCSSICINLSPVCLGLTRYPYYVAVVLSFCPLLWACIILSSFILCPFRLCPSLAWVSLGFVSTWIWALHSHSHLLHGNKKLCPVLCLVLLCPASRAWVSLALVSACTAGLTPSQTGGLDTIHCWNPYYSSDCTLSALVPFLQGNTLDWCSAVNLAHG